MDSVQAAVGSHDSFQFLKIVFSERSANSVKVVFSEHTVDLNPWPRYNSVMVAISKLNETHLKALCDVIGDTSIGLTGSQIGELLNRCGIDDPLAGFTKRNRLFEALRARQEKDACANVVLAFVQMVMEPVRFVGKQQEFDRFKTELNAVLVFCGLQVGENGKLRSVAPARTLSEAQERAGRLRSELLKRKVHHDVLRFCREELLQENYFHAVFEATKSVAEKIRDKTGLTGDGADLVDKAFGLSAPMLAINTLRTETERSEQSGFANLVKGMFGTFRNVTGHAPKIIWPIGEEDALDLLSIVSYIHRRLDNAAQLPHPRSPTLIP